MSTKMMALVATAILFGSTAFAAAQSEMDQKSDQITRKPAPHRAVRPDPYAGNSWDNGARYERRMAPGAYYNYAPGTGNYYSDYAPSDYYNRDYWNGVQNGTPDFSAGTAYYNYAPGPGNYYPDYPPGNYYNSDYWNGVGNFAPDLPPAANPYVGNPFDNVAPY
jgi:hypothetical protein